MAKEKKTVKNADEQINKQLYNIAANIVERDNIDRLREKTRAISNRNTEHRDKNGMMDTLTQIMYNNKSHRTSSTNKIRVSTEERKHDLKNLLNASLGVDGITNMDSKRINRYNDCRVIHEYIPELSTSLDVLRDSILSPDDFSKKNAFFAYDDGSKDDSLTETERLVFESKIKDLSEKFGIDQFIKDSVRDSLLLGDDFTIVRPIKNEFIEVLSEDVTESSDGYLLKDEGEYITEDIFQDSVMSQLGQYLNETADNLLHIDGKTNKNDPTDIIKEVVSNVKDNLLVVKNPETLLTDKKRAYKEFSNLQGAYFKHIRPDDIIKLELDHVCIGYLYFDRSIDQDVNGILGHTGGNTTLLQSMTSALNSDSNSSGSSSVNQSVVGGTSFTHTDNGQLATEGNTAKAYDALVRIFSRGISEKINKRFLEDNSEFREVILSLLKNDYLITKKVAVTFLEPEDVIHNKVESSETYGKSVYKNGLFFAKLYLINVLNTMMIKINQGRDKRVFYVENGLDDDFEGIIEGLIRDLRSKEIPNDFLSNENSITTVMRQIGSLENFYIPVTDGARAFDIDVVPGMQVDVDDNELDRLLRSAQRSTGVPYNYIDASTDVDFSRTLAIQNQGFVKTILSFQGSFSEYYTKIIQKLWKYEYGTEDASTYKKSTSANQKSPDSSSPEGTDGIIPEYIKVSFPAPVALNADTLNERISSTEQLIEYLTNLHYPEETDDNREVRRIFKKNLAKDVYLRNVDWDLIKQVKDSTDEEYKLNELDPKPKSNEDSDTSMNF